jgi:hypothetical protein
MRNASFGKAGGILTVVAALILLLSAVLPACGNEKAPRGEARELFDRISSLDPNAPDASRRARLQDLERLQLRDPALARVRDVCLTAHGGMLEAEDAQAVAKRSLAAAEQRNPGGGIPAVEAQRIADAIDRSNRALAAAQAALPRCEEQSRELALRAR